MWHSQFGSIIWTQRSWSFNKLSKSNKLCAPIPIFPISTDSNPLLHTQSISWIGIHSAPSTNQLCFQLFSALLLHQNFKSALLTHKIKQPFPQFHFNVLRRSHSCPCTSHFHRGSTPFTSAIAKKAQLNHFQIVILKKNGKLLFP